MKIIAVLNENESSVAVQLMYAVHVNMKKSITFSQLKQGTN